MLKRVVVFAACVLALMVAVKDGRVLAKTGLKGSCAVVRVDADGSQLQGCHAGKLEGMPDLRRQGCKYAGKTEAVEYWSCPASVVAAPGS
jgi:hypothetical protein